MKIKSCLIILIFAFLFFASNAQTLNDGARFRVVGYYSLDSAMTADLKIFPFNKLTHINLYFLNPDSSGNFTRNFSAFIPFIKAAHTKNVAVLASIAGGGKHPYYAKLLKDNNRGNADQQFTFNSVTI